ncbi:hypothetical protein HYALB_00001817 [Hymenoscyphus albidus]|uniref:Uncharacterized protein n=1 Tax=Hymenoscyphus albidus TaxID=595503 RepID=A0A9N9LR86_9HELO|nr:hypothetical protein HYALB_00001817 [Hymenoscyphus albidus]
MSSPMSQQTISHGTGAALPTIHPICCPSAPIPTSGPTPYLTYFLRALHELIQEDKLHHHPLFQPFVRSAQQKRIWPPPSHRVLALQICQHVSCNTKRDSTNEKYYIFQCDMEDVSASVVQPVMDVKMAEMYPVEAWREVDWAVVELWLRRDEGELWMEKEERKEGREVLWFCKGCDVQVWLRELGVARE